MAEYSQSPSNYSMLTNHMHILFRCYILSGRMRAPPEFELGDLIQTFHPGAKTNRRALQSKFKSWARRMDVRNGKLVLTNTGKLIIPEEKCDELILGLHFKDHLPIDQVILQIKRNYTWTKKNFGMDRETVSNSIVRNCPNAECRKEMRKHFSNRNYSKILFSGPLLPPGSRRFAQNAGLMNQVIFPTSAPGWVMNFPEPMNISSSEYRVPPSFFSNETSPATVSLTNTRQPSIMPCSWIQNNRKSNFEAGKPTESNNDPNSTTLIPLPERYRFPSDNTNSSKDDRQCFKPCKKVSNIHEFKDALQASKFHPEMFPKVLTHPKTHFFSKLDLAPKRICTKSTLSTFNRERRIKQIYKKQLWYGGECKTLRDRNKLNKTRPLSQEADGSPQGRCVSGLLKSSKRHLATPQNTGRKVERPDNTNYGPILPSTSCSATKPEPELIDIASSSDEDEDCPATKFGRRDEDAPKTGSFKLILSKVNGALKKPGTGSMVYSASSADAAFLRPPGLQFNKPIAMQKHLYSEAGSCDPNSKLETKNASYKDIKGYNSMVVRPIAIRPKVFNNQIRQLQEKNCKVILVEKTSNGTYQLINPYPLYRSTPVTSKRAKQLVGAERPPGSQLKPKSETATKQRLLGNDSTANREKDKNSIKRNIDCEMKRLCNWISKMKSFVTPTIFRRGAERPTQRLTAQLNVGIQLVRDVRRAVFEVETNKNMDVAATENQDVATTVGSTGNLDVAVTVGSTEKQGVASTVIAIENKSVTAISGKTENKDIAATVGSTENLDVAVTVGSTEKQDVAATVISIENKDVIATAGSTKNKDIAATVGSTENLDVVANK